MAFLYMRPDEWASLSATVTTSAGATDSDYIDDWVADGRPGRPAKSTTGTVTWSLTFSSAEVGLVAICNCNSDVNVTIGGTVSGTVTAGALQPNGIRLNGFQTFTPASGTTLTVAVSGAASAVTLGEVMAGKYRTLTAPRFDSTLSENDFGLSAEAEFASIHPFDRGLVARTLKGSQLYTTADRDLILAWQRAQRANSRPSLIVPDSTVNDAWVVLLSPIEYTQVGPGLWEVELEFQEYPRSRW